MLEAAIERYLTRRVKELGGISAKMTISGRRGWPDRLVILPGAGMALVELKRPKKSELSLHQRSLHANLRAMGVAVEVLWSREDVDAFLDGMRGNAQAEGSDWE